MPLVEPLNFYQIFVQYFAGSLEIFFFLAAGAFAYLAARFRMTNQVFLLMMALFVVIMSNYYGGLYVLTILLAGLFIYYTLGKLIKD